MVPESTDVHFLQRVPVFAISPKHTQQRTVQLEIMIGALNGIFEECVKEKASTICEGFRI
jgi:hypothetical protein